jgi:hypothetical protein
MTTDINHVPEGTVIHIGPKGGEYVILTEGKKHYIRRYRDRPSKTFKARRGAYLRFIENQSMSA